MTLKNFTFVATDGRDAGKNFLVTEKDAMTAEKWSMRVLMAAMAAGVELPSNGELSGSAGLLSLSINALSRIKWEVAEPLLDEMLTCVEYIPTPSKPHVKRALFTGDIEEVSTLLTLRKEIIGVHTDFFSNAVTSTTGG